MPLPVGSGYVVGATVIVPSEVSVAGVPERGLIEMVEDYGFLHVRYLDGAGQRIHVSNVILEEETV